MEKTTLLDAENKFANFDWDKLPEFERSNELSELVEELNLTFATSTFYALKSSLLNDINYHIYILKKYGNFDSRSRFNVNEGDYLFNLWNNFKSYLIKHTSELNENSLVIEGAERQKPKRIKSETVINYLEWFGKKIENTNHYGDLVLLFYKVQDIFLELYIKQN